ncbi:MAG TPA: SAM-dependent methyltransferase [Streptosporangiaceae bacterium]|nr:SAM-dependent methyltransferase [Streptosporangiaceae bacterium]
MQFDVSKPNVARVYDYLLGGKNNFGADRDEAERILAVYPELAQRVRENRAFLGRAVSMLAGAGIAQFLDLGPGLPTAASTHEVAQSVNSGSRVVYVDNDPVVVLHAQALLEGPNVTAVTGDIADPAAVLARPEVTALIRPDEPLAVIMASVLHFFDAETVKRIIAGYMGTAVPGSYVVASVAWTDHTMRPQLAHEYTAASFWNYSPDDLRDFLAGLEIVDPPGIADARHWTAGQAAQPVRDLVRMIAAVARKPEPG